MNKIKLLRNICVILLVGIFCYGCIDYLHTQGKIFNLSYQSNETMGFRSQKIGEDNFRRLMEVSKTEDVPIYDLLSVWMPKYQFELENVKTSALTPSDYYLWRTYFQAYNLHALQEIQQSYAAVWEDVMYYPVPDRTTEEESQTSFEDSWMLERNYGGKRGHEGTDIFPRENIRGKYPVVSVSNGVVEQVGWLEKGGWRIGIRSEHGGYFYYAHLSSYAGDFKKGDEIQAGELLGYMGDTGYSKIEGTTGNFDVHLHFGIYIKTAGKEEVSVNPYWVLRYLEDRKLKYAYEV